MDVLLTVLIVCIIRTANSRTVFVVHYKHCHEVTKHGLLTYRGLFDNHGSYSNGRNITCEIKKMTCECKINNDLYLNLFHIPGAYVQHQQRRFNYEIRI